MRDTGRAMAAEHPLMMAAALVLLAGCAALVRRCVRRGSAGVGANDQEAAQEFSTVADEAGGQSKHTGVSGGAAALPRERVPPVSEDSIWGDTGAEERAVKEAMRAAAMAVRAAAARANPAAKGRVRHGYQPTSPEELDQ